MLFKRLSRSIGFQLLIGGLLLTATLLSWHFSRRGIQNYERIRFAQAKNLIIRDIKSRMETYVSALVQTKSMFHVTREVDREEFRYYVDELSILDQYPGIQGIGYSKKISPAELRSGKYNVWPSHSADEQYPIVLLEPQDWRNKRALGYDMYTDPVRREAMDLARDTGLPAMSGVVQLVQETGMDKQPGFNIYTPVYEKGRFPKTLEERRKYLRGFIYGPFRSKDFFSNVMAPHDNLAVDVEVEILKDNSGRIYDRLPENARSKGLPSTTTELEIAQKRWRITVSAQPSFIQKTNIFPTVILCLGTLISLLVTIFMVTTMRQAKLLEDRSYSKDKLIEASHKLTAKLELKELLQSLTDIGRELCGAQFGAFFYNTVDEKGESYMLYTVSGVPREKFTKFPMPRNTAVFAETFGGGSLMSGDITKDHRYGKNAPFHGLPKGHLPVRSYLSVAVKGRSGDVIGGLFYGHASPNVFRQNEKLLIEGLAPQAAVAIENARLFDEARAAVTLREDFLRIASHELKTPITSMKLQFQAAQRMISSGNEKVFDRESVKKRVQTAVTQLDKMTKLIDDMLDSSRVSLDQFKMTITQFDLVKLTRDLLDRYTEQLSNLGIALVRDFDESARIDIEGDEYRIEQVISNIINNAIKYGEKNPITVSLKKEEDMVLIEVRDQGMGIPKEAQPNVFKRYERAVPAMNISGLGLGLYISSRIVEAHGGSIKIESELGKGTVVTVSLPQTQSKA